MADTQNRGPWIIASAILLAALLIAGVLIYQNRQDRCEELRDRLAELDPVADTLALLEAEEEYAERCE